MSQSSNGQENITKEFEKIGVKPDKEDLKEVLLKIGNEIRNLSLATSVIEMTLESKGLKKGEEEPKLDIEAIVKNYVENKRAENAKNIIYDGNSKEQNSEIEQESKTEDVEKNYEEIGRQVVKEAIEKLNSIKENGKEKAKEWGARFLQNSVKAAYSTVGKATEIPGKVKDAKNAVVETAGKVVENIKEAPGKIDKAIQDKQMEHASDVFEKRKNRRTLKGKTADLLSAISYKLKEAKQKGKQELVDNYTIAKAYVEVGKDKVAKKKLHLQMQFALAKGKLTSSKEALKLAIKGAKVKFGDKVNDLKEGIKSAAIKTGQSLQTAGATVVNGTVNGIREGVDAVKTGASNAMTHVANQLLEAAEKINPEKQENDVSVSEPEKDDDELEL